MRAVCDYVSLACGDPATTHRFVSQARTKYLCDYHAATIARHPAMSVLPAGADRFPLAVGTAGPLQRVA